MKHICYLLFFGCFISVFALAQTDTVSAKPDSTRRDSLPLVNDTTKRDSLTVQGDSSLLYDSLSPKATDSFVRKPQHKPAKTNETKTGNLKIFAGKEYLFYFLIFLLLVFGFLRMAFAKYFYDLFRVFFRTTLKQKQVREQMLQSPLPSVLMNCFFVVTAGLYINFLLVHFQLSVTENFWLQYVYCMAALAFIYIIKFLGLKITGWLFSVNDTAESYTFIVFIINKMLGLMLLPFLILLAFTSDPIYSAVLSLSWVGVSLLLGYRFILTYGAARNEIKLNPFHFFLYIIAFEVVPLLLIYKLLLIIF